MDNKPGNPADPGGMPVDRGASAGNADPVPAATLQRLSHLFRHAGTDAATLALYAAILEYRTRQAP
jgi:hypothetical protein